MNNIMYEMDRLVNQELWFYILPGAIADGDNAFSNSVFKIVPYDWNSDEEQEYNFWHKPSGIKIRWYKYPLRSPECSDIITPLQLREILIDCLNSIHPSIHWHVDKWWERGDKNG